MKGVVILIKNTLAFCKECLRLVREASNSPVLDLEIGDFITNGDDGYVVEDIRGGTGYF